MDDKEFGRRLRQLRREKGLTMEQLCEDEKEISVRQLGRIEAGKSKPTLSKMNSIAKRLGVSLYQLMPDYKPLPAAYLQIKYDLLRTPTYGHPDLLRQRADLLQAVYEDYYDDLPEDEQVALDALQSTYDVIETKTSDFGHGIIAEYFHQIQIKDRFSLNDLLIIRLFVEHVRYHPDYKDAEEQLLALIETLLMQQNHLAKADLFVLRDLLFAIVGLLGNWRVHHPMPDLFEAIDRIMQVTQDFQEKAILSMLRWKYARHVEKSEEQAYHYYQEAVAFARLIGNSHLVEQLEEDWNEESR
ncbi:helix-turn-helix domain-containing protein [Streptococcus suis]|uniref:helix-turn-helix domain-containing protein n=1 Tax=Streptococcus suis TaxID=1307 RepID=UPI001ABE4C2B|nr:helix-turn-helix domain-containing protein [Streptococcus suis]